MTTGEPPSSEERLQTIEQKIAKLEKRPKDTWDKLQSVSALLSGVLVAIVGYYLTGTINRGLQERQFQFSSAKDMQELLTRLNDPTVSLENKQSTALVLAAFGKYAIDPLVNLIQSGDANRMVAAEGGLRAIGHSDQESLCAELRLVIDNRTRIFSWYTHRSAIRLMREAVCASALPSLRNYGAILDRAEKFATFVHPDFPPTEESVDLIKEELKKALLTLDKIR
jgi:hypothetical protein